MQLKNLNVLVDGYNLELSKGTGIKTYGISLIQALEVLEANVNVLFSRYTANTQSDNVYIKSDLEPSFKLTKKKKIQLFIKILLRNIYQAKIISLPDYLIESEADFALKNLFQNHTVFNQLHCYEIANFLFKKFSFDLKIETSKKVDIWHATYPLPITIKHAKKITTIHDLIPLKLPDLTLDDKPFFYNLIQYSIKTSNLLITVSENSKKDLVSIFNCDPNKIFVTYQPIAFKTNTKTDNIATILNEYQLENKKYILFVGAIEPKKNLGRLIDAYTLINTDFPLIIVGKKGWSWENDIEKIEKILREDNPSKIRLLDYVTPEDLPYLYQGAYCFVFPSLYEGFGLPPLEAMSFGCPVITSNVSSLPEICGGAALYVDPYNVNDIAEKLNQLLNNNHLRMQLSEAGKERAKLFSMDNYVNKLYQAYESALRET